MQFRPLHDHVLVKRLEASEERIGGIIIPIPRKKNPKKGKYWPLVLANCSTTVPGGPMAVAAGNKVLFGKYAGTEITLDGDELPGVT